MTYDPAKLALLAAERKRIATRLSHIEPELKEQIAAAGFEGAKQQELVEMTGYTRDTIRLIWRKAGVPSN
jgi:hypothetical protein